ncbi:hypothetical protein [Desulfosporosinus sp. Sb-LF]|uniref:hypothetical protein n=1 Tax=Desulfosporosinus sp. Sb-LF TaxID=2560027 RepID=UPI00107F8F0F|nr:hypothetical protein [Desulfosporosinus sp. Sb-LF]TGE33926.1 hypothetical protein E4K68_03710 [Desulfosporosinus sp. Sb-LF]
MTFLPGVVLILGILLWIMDSPLEWNIPYKWQVFLKTWKEGLGSRTHNLNYVYYRESDLNLGNSDLEKQFLHLQKELPRLSRKLRVPLWISVCVHQGMVSQSNEIYISCLQRRFPEMEIYESSLYVNCDVEGEITPLSGSNHREGEAYELFPDVE